MKAIIITVAASLVLVLPLAKPTAGPASRSPKRVDYARATNLSASIQPEPTLAHPGAASPNQQKPAQTVTPAAAAAPGPAVPAHPASPPAAAKPVTYAAGCSTYRSTFAQYAWDIDVALAICQAESGGNPYSVSPAYMNFDGCPDYGLMQIHCQQVFDPGQNIAIAYHKYQSQGWGAWSTYLNGKYARFL